MVADIETLPYKIGNQNVKSHVAYTAGYMLVTPGVKPDKRHIIKFYANDYHYYVIENDFLERSTKMLSDMITRVIILFSLKKVRRSKLLS